MISIFNPDSYILFRSKSIGLIGIEIVCLPILAAIAIAFLFDLRLMVGDCQTVADVPKNIGNEIT